MYLSAREDAAPATIGNPPLSEGGVQIIAIDVAFLVLGTLMVALRLVARKIKRVELHSEDYVVFAGLAMYYVNGIATVIAVVVGGLGNRGKDLTADQRQTTRKIMLLIQMTYALMITLIKSSICLILKRIFIGRAFRIAVNITLSICIAWGLMIIIRTFLLCRPFAYNWDQSIPDGYCASKTAAYASGGALDILTDVMIMILPLPVIRKLQMPTRTKIALAGVFCLGILTIVIGVFRVVAAVNTDYVDPIYEGRFITFWTVSEPGVALLVACAPLLRPLFDKFFPLASLSGRSRVSAGPTVPSRGRGSGPFSKLESEEVGLRPLVRTAEEDEYR